MNRSKEKQIAKGIILVAAIALISLGFLYNWDSFVQGINEGRNWILK